MVQISSFNCTVLHSLSTCSPFRSQSHLMAHRLWGYLETFLAHCVNAPGMLDVAETLLTFDDETFRQLMS